MKVNFNKLSFFAGIVLSTLIACAASAAETGERSIGRVLFSGNSSREIMIYSSIENPSVIAGVGSILNIGKADRQILVKITDICGLYIRCSCKDTDEADYLAIKEGDEVLYSDKNNVSVKYYDVKRVLGVLIKLYENFIYRVEAVDDPVVLSESVDRFSAELEALIPEMERLNSKYPELKNFYTAPPDVLKHESEVLKMLEPALKNTFFKINIYAEDAAVKKSVQKLQKVFEKMKAVKK